MKTVTSVKMAQAIRTLGGLAILHRFGDYDDPRFVVISNSGLIESHPHNVKL